jgi:hypothetical protein
MDQDLERYYDPSDPGAFGGLERLYQSLKDDGKPVTRSQVKDFLAHANTYTLHKPKRSKFPRNKILTFHKDYQWAMDLADMGQYSRQNNGYKYILTVLDTFTKYLWCVPIKNKQPDQTVKALLTILKQGRVPERIRSDKGGEFVNNKMEKLLKQYQIQHLITANKTYKAATVERVQKTMKDRMFRYFTRTGTHRYIDVLSKFVASYNDSMHRAIKMTPNQAVDADTNTVFKNLYGFVRLSDMSTRVKPKIKKGSTVRIAYDRGVFDKGYWRTFSDNTATVDTVLNRPRPMYVLKDASGPFRRKFYEQELQQIPEPSYRIEKVIKTKKVRGKTQYLVKFIGYTVPEWVDNLESV